RLAGRINCGSSRSISVRATPAGWTPPREGPTGCGQSAVECGAAVCRARGRGEAPYRLPLVRGGPPVDLAPRSGRQHLETGCDEAPTRAIQRRVDMRRAL